jgi:endo-beta-N-acetylglucosaminidase D
MFLKASMQRDRMREMQQVSGSTPMERQNAAHEAMSKTPEELVSYAVERTHDDSFRQSIVKLEFERRVAIAQIETANATKLSARRMLWSVIALVVTGIVSALVQCLAWMYPHIAK